jgi:hypothetical protein
MVFLCVHVRIESSCHCINTRKAADELEKLIRGGDIVKHTRVQGIKCW